MKTISLGERVAQRTPPDIPVLISELGDWSPQTLIAASEAAPIVHAALFDAVVLRLHSPLKLVLALAGLDGRIPRLLLLSSDVPTQQAQQLIEQFNADAILSDLPPLQLPHHIGGIDWFAAAQAEPNPTTIPAAFDKETQWTFATSGTTGIPKLVTHDLASLSRSAKSLGKSVKRWGQTYNIARFAGVQVCLQALLGGTLVLPKPEWELTEQLSYFAKQGCNALSATPTLWRKILMTPSHEQLRLEQITVGGEIADDAILSALAKQYPKARVTHIYASTEAGTAFSVSDGRAGFPLHYLSATPSGIALKLINGHLFVQSRASRTTYLNREEAFADVDGYVATGDLVQARGNRCYFLGRANGTINVGGNKVLPEEVEQVLLDHEAVKLARVFAKTNPITGNLVAAEIVPVDPLADKGDLRRQLTHHCQTRLEKWKIPALLTIVDELKTTTSGKAFRGNG